jgi:THO complex subunit 1
VWNLFDILSVLSDHDQCDPALLVWLVEELLDSQTTERCRKVFDYLESRRERIIAKNLNKKQLVILRSCNELLRRLSRAEDTAFCGRVFIFMFQSFPLHDRSSVNLRGEYHVENVTTFEDTAPQPDATGETMDVDTDADKAKDEKDSKTVTATATKAVSFDSKNKAASDEPLDPNALYPLFWSLQHSFSQPLSLFDQAQFTKFKEGMEATLTAFEKVDRLQKATKTTEESKTIPQKRKSPEAADERDGSNYNPKYLTSRDLFELEVSNRHIPMSLRHVLI